MEEAGLADRQIRVKGFRFDPPGALPGGLFTDTREQISIIDQQIVRLPQFIDKLAKAFPAEDKATVGEMLDNEWPVFHSKMLKPLDKLVTFSEASVKQTYEASRTSGQRLIYVILGVCGVGVLVLLAGILLLAKNINCGVRGLKMTLAKVRIRETIT